MASKMESSTEAKVANVTLKHASTNQEISCELDINPKDVLESDVDGQVLQDASFEFVREGIEADPDLTEKQKCKLRFLPEDESSSSSSEEEASPGTPPVRPVVAIAGILKDYAKEVEVKVKNDPVIEKETGKIISECFKKQGSDETDSGPEGRVTFDLNSLWTHIREVFQLLLADSSHPDASVITVLTQLGAGLGYCFYLIKRIAIEYIETLTFKEVVYIICKVLSQLFRHLMQIQFGSLLKKIGGWNSILTTAVVDQGTQMIVERATRYIPYEYLLLGMGIVSFLGFGYLKFIRK
ncbi:uncharacterized protein LOC135344545 [Halichondria panicea]|uniref:uncharacterized protein LOC135344545 n=1 Tax=Halichondria panicea TaxID=6063 RepID=UPI00312BB2F2